MRIELISVLVAMAATGVALAGLILTNIRGLRLDMARMETRLDGRIDALESRVDGFQSQVDRQFSALRERMANVEGLLSGLREAIVKRSIAS